MCVCVCVCVCESVTLTLNMPVFDKFGSYSPNCLYYILQDKHPNEEGKYPVHVFVSEVDETKKDVLKPRKLLFSELKCDRKALKIVWAEDSNSCCLVLERNAVKVLQNTPGFIYMHIKEGYTQGGYAPTDLEQLVVLPTKRLVFCRKEIIKELPCVDIMCYDVVEKKTERIVLLEGKDVILTPLDGKSVSMKVIQNYDVPEGKGDMAFLENVCYVFDPQLSVETISPEEMNVFGGKNDPSNTVCAFIMRREGTDFVDMVLRECGTNAYNIISLERNTRFENLEILLNWISETKIVIGIDKPNYALLLFDFEKCKLVEIGLALPVKQVCSVSGTHLALLFLGESTLFFIDLEALIASKEN